MKNKRDKSNSAADVRHLQGVRHLKSATATRLRKTFILIHRYVGLVMAVFLVVAGITGSLIAFHDELDAAINRSLLKVEPPHVNAELMHPLKLRDELAAKLPGVRINWVPLEQKTDEASVFYVDWEGENTTKDDTWFVNPYTAKILGSRTYGDISQGVKNLMPFIYRLHYSLALGTVGSYIFGIIALLWTIDCFVGAYITFPPPSQKKRTTKEWFKRWKPSWLVRANKLFAFVFTFHRASGLWIWALLFVFAWSSVGLNLREVYNPVMKTVFGDTGGHQIERLDKPLKNPSLSWNEAYSIGQNHLSELSKEHGFNIEWERNMRYYPHIGAYILVVSSSLDIADKIPFTAVYMDGNSGKLLWFSAPTGQNTANTVSTWLNRLHFGDIKALGLPYRIFVSLLGLVVAFLSVSGVWIWLKKRKKKTSGRAGKNNGHQPLPNHLKPERMKVPQKPEKEEQAVKPLTTIGNR